MDIEVEVQRVVRHLKDLIEDSDVPRQEIDRRLGHSRGYLGQLLSGAIDLKYWHLVRILETIECSPQHFLDQAFPLRNPAPHGPVPETEVRFEALRAALQIDKDRIDVYGFGIDAVRELRRRLERCEESLRAVKTHESSKGTETC